MTFSGLPPRRPDSTEAPGDVAREEPPPVLAGIRAAGMTISLPMHCWQAARDTVALKMDCRRGARSREETGQQAGACLPLRGQHTLTTAPALRPASMAGVSRLTAGENTPAGTKTRPL